MRKVLLAGAAIGAVSLVGAPEAFAQRTEFPQPYAPTNASPALRTTPGVTVRLAGRYRVYAGVIDQDGDTDANGNKLSNVDFLDYARLWTGFDGLAENGLQYGATLEIRTGGSQARGDDRGGLFYRRMYGYVGTPTMGQLRVGSGQSQAVELMYTGHYQGKFASGLWDGDAPGFVTGAASQAASLFWFSSSSGNNNTAIGYYTPQFYGFDFGVSYSPNTGNFTSGNSTNFLINDRLSDSSSSTGTIRPTNIFDIMARYRGTFSGVGLAVSGGYRGSSTVDGVMNPNTNLFPNEFEGLSIGVLGLEASVAGFTFGGNISFGTANFGNGLTGGTGGLTPLAKTTAGGNGRTAIIDDDDMLSWQLGVGYSFGAITIGGGYGEAKYAGAQTVSDERKTQFFGLGGSYAVAPGFSLFAEYLWSKTEESGWNFQTGTAGPGNNSVDVNAFSIGTAFNW